MKSAASFVRRNLAYVFVVFALIWLGMALLTGSAFVLWPVLACGASGALLRFTPASGLAASLPTASAMMGLFLSAYQVYAATPLLAGAFSAIAGISVATFVLLGLGHVYLAYACLPARPAK
ncbi:MAG: hypothetical protein LYZ70_05365 [Nitrososphaerales archaeon]|nr:hypothetical protein [Nitrososphaerales archaeon]